MNLLILFLLFKIIYVKSSNCIKLVSIVSRRQSVIRRRVNNNWVSACDRFVYLFNPFYLKDYE